MGHQGTLGIVTGHPEAVPQAGSELSLFFAFPDYDSAYRRRGASAWAGVATFAGAVLFDEWKVADLRRDDEGTSPSPAT